MFLILKIKNALAHRKSFQAKNWGHYFVDSCQAQAELAESLGVNPTTISKRFESIKNDSKARILDAVQVEAERRQTASCHTWTAASTAEKESFFCFVFFAPYRDRR